MDVNFQMMVASGSAGFAIAFGAVGPSIGIGKIASAGLKAVHYQPASAGPVTKNMLIGMAVTESSAIFALVTAMILLFTPIAAAGWEKVFALAGAGICIGLGTLGSGIGEGMIASRAIENISRSPKSEQTTTRFMLLTQAITESPAVFALVIALSLIFVEQPKSGIVYAMALLASGVCMGIGAIGPAFGEGYAASKACAAVGKKPESFNSVIRILLLGMALAESCAVYAMVVSLCIMYFA
jgi:F-type H+-transporting ATPase subunit c